MSELRCLHCGYTLHRLPLQDNTIRCPECGIIADLDEMAVALVERRRWEALLSRDTMVMFVAVWIIVTLSAVFDGLPGVAALWTRIEFILSNTGAAAALGMTGFLFILTCTRWFGLSRSERLCFAGTTTFLALVVPLPWGAVAVIAWLVGFYVRAEYACLAR